MGLPRVKRGYRGLQRVTKDYRRPVFELKRPEILLNYERLQGVTGDYRALQGVTWGYKKLQGVAGGYRWLQGVTGDYKKLQGLTEDKRRLAFLTSTSPDTFSSSILHKNQG